MLKVYQDGNVVLFFFGFLEKKNITLFMKKRKRKSKWVKTTIVVTMIYHSSLFYDKTDKKFNF